MPYSNAPGPGWASSRRHNADRRRGAGGRWEPSAPAKASCDRRPPHAARGAATRAGADRRAFRAPSDPPIPVDMTSRTGGLRLFGWYVLASAIPIALLGLGLAHQYQTQMDRRALDQAASEADAIANAGIEPVLDGPRPRPAARRERERAAARRDDPPAARVGERPPPPAARPQGRRGVRRGEPEPGPARRSRRRGRRGRRRRGHPQAHASEQRHRSTRADQVGAARGRGVHPAQRDRRPTSASSACSRSTCRTRRSATRSRRRTGRWPC